MLRMRDLRYKLKRWVRKILIHILYGRCFGRKNHDFPELTQHGADLAKICDLIERDRAFRAALYGESGLPS